MPVYSSIGSMQCLEKELKKKAYGLLAEYQAKAYTENELLNIAVGQVLFAKDEPMLYKFLHMDSPTSLSSKEQTQLMADVSRRLGHTITFESYFGMASPKMIDTISMKSWIFIHGLSMGLMNGNLPKMDDKAIISLVKEAGGAFVAWEKKKSTDTPAQ